MNNIITSISHSSSPFSKTDSSSENKEFRDDPNDVQIQKRIKETKKVFYSISTSGVSLALNDDTFLLSVKTPMSTFEDKMEHQYGHSLVAFLSEFNERSNGLAKSLFGAFAHSEKIKVLSDILDFLDVVAADEAVRRDLQNRDCVELGTKLLVMLRSVSLAALEQFRKTQRIECGGGSGVSFKIDNGTLSVSIETAVALVKHKMKHQSLAALLSEFDEKTNGLARELIIAFIYADKSKVIGDIPDFLDVVAADKTIKRELQNRHCVELGTRLIRMLRAVSSTALSKL